MNEYDDYSSAQEINAEIGRLESEGIWCEGDEEALAAGPVERDPIEECRILGHQIRGNDMYCSHCYQDFS
jgi:hypothetical protein